MLMVLDISNIPKNYTGNHRIISITPDTKHFQYIPFALANFITESEENSLLSWCSRQNLNVTSQFIHTNTTDIDHWTDYWEIVFECNASVDFAIQNSSFTDLITEIKTFIDICCCLKITNEEAISVLKKHRFIKVGQSAVEKRTICRSYPKSYRCPHKSNPTRHKRVAR